jgi:hypothetical protein
MMTNRSNPIPFNSPLETGIRSLAILVAAHPASFDLERLVEMDYLVVHSGDVNGPESLHAALPMRAGELLVRRGLIEKGLLLMMSRNLIQRILAEDGFNYVAGDAAAPFLASLTSIYSLSLKKRAQWAVEFLSQITNYASQLGAEEDVEEALSALGQLTDERDEMKANKTRAVARASANRQLRHRFLEVLQEGEPAEAAGTGKCVSLSEANSIVVRPLLRLWEQIPESIASSYDFWGRGNFVRLLLNARCFPNSFNVTLEVRSLDDVKRAVRLWGLFADFLILLWKGVTKNGLAITPFPEDYEEPGGWGYMIAAGTIIKKEGSSNKFYPAMAQISALPDEVAAFLATEARPFIQSGRLIVVPAVGAGCINPGHGPFEQLLAESANAIPSIRWKGFAGTPIGYIPHSPNAPFELLAELAEAESDRLRKLRLLLLKRSQELEPGGKVGLVAKRLSLEIDDALRDLEERNNAVARKKGLDKAKEPLTGGTARFRSSGKKLTATTPDSPFAPLLILQSLGYGWRVDGPEVPKLPPRFEPEEGDVIGTWLAPPSAGWNIPTVRVRTP